MKLYYKFNICLVFTISSEMTKVYNNTENFMSDKLYGIFN